MNIYNRLCFCTKCNKKFNSLFEYGYHVFENRNESITNLKDFRRFVEKEIIKQLNSIKFVKQQSLYYQKKLLSLVKKQLKKETNFPINLLLPDGKRIKIL